MRRGNPTQVNPFETFYRWHFRITRQTEGINISAGSVRLLTAKADCYTLITGGLHFATNGAIPKAQYFVSQWIPGGTSGNYDPATQVAIPSATLAAPGNFSRWNAYHVQSEAQMFNHIFMRNGEELVVVFDNNFPALPGYVVIGLDMRVIPKDISNGIDVNMLEIDDALVCA